MIAIYFSATGNTKHCAGRLIAHLGGVCVSIESEACSELLKHHNDVILAYPIYFSDLPRIVRDFLYRNGASFSGKNVFILATMEILAATEQGARLGF